MSEEIASTRLAAGRYRIEHLKNGWSVLDPAGNEVFPDLEFRLADDAAKALLALASVDRIGYVPLHDRRGTVREVIIGGPPHSDFSQHNVVLKIVLSAEIDADLGHMAEELDVTKGQAVLKGISLLKIALDATREGKRIAIIDDDDDSEQDITGLQGLPDVQ